MRRFFHKSSATFACVLLATALGFGQTKSKTEKTEPPATATKAPKAPPAAQIDLNSATKEQLMKLPGIGDVKAQAIIDGRPYANKAQLVSRKILTQDAYDKIAAQVIAKEIPGAKAPAATKAPAKAPDKAKTKFR